MAELILQEEAGTPSTPGANKWKAYFKSTGLYILEDTGVETLVASVATDGWIAAPGTFTYSSIDTPSGVLSVNQDYTNLVALGRRLKFTQTQALTVGWDFNTNSNSQVGTHNGTDTAMTYTAGKFSNAATFNGTTSKIVLTDHANLKPTGAFTVGLWFKTSSTGAIKMLFQSYSANTAIAGFNVFISPANVITFTLGKNTGTVLGTDYSQLVGSTTVTDGTFHYLVVTFKNNYAQVYLDGVLEIAGYAYTPAYAGTNYPRIGVLNTTGTDGSFMNGQIDDLFLINGYALDEATIKAKYVANSAQGTGAISVVKMGIITKIGAYSGGATLITIYTGTDYELANASISNVYYSTIDKPVGFPTNPDKWTVLISDQVTTYTKASPTANQYYSGSTLSASFPAVVQPIGAWDTKVQAQVQTVITLGAAGNVSCRFGLSEVNDTIPSQVGWLGLFLMSMPAMTGATLRLIVTLTGKRVGLVKKTLYPVIATGNSSVTTIDIVGFFSVSFVSAYL